MADELRLPEKACRTAPKSFVPAGNANDGGESKQTGVYTFGYMDSRAPGKPARKDSGVNASAVNPARTLARLAAVACLLAGLSACNSNPPATKTEAAPMAASAPAPVAASAPVETAASAPIVAPVTAPDSATIKQGEEHLNRLLLGTLKADQHNNSTKSITDPSDVEASIATEFHDFIHPPAYHGNENAETLKTGIAKGKRGAAAGDPFWLNFMGLSYITGRGIPRDTAKGLQLVERAAKAGNTTANCTLARLNDIGLIVPMNKPQAIEFYKECGKKEAGGWPLLRVGQMYEFGFGVERDLQQAMNWYQHSASDPLAGNVKAQFIVGRMYAKGIGVSRSYKKAAEWFTRAAGLKSADRTHVQRSADAVCAMAIMYKYGVGVDKNPAKSEQMMHLDLGHALEDRAGTPEARCREL
jgi:hypothetical protein